MEQVSLSINGVNVVAMAGMSILEAARDNGFHIPTLCHHPHLKPAGACRLCIVEDEKSGRIMASCVTPVAAGMVIRTDSPLLKSHRTQIVRLMMANHPESCIVCNKGNRCGLRLLAGELGIGATGLYPMPHYMRLEEANPFIVRDLTKCILCGKCIRADHELVAVGAIDYNLRGFRSRPATVHAMPLEKSSCTFCGTCVSMCPTGALMAKNGQYAGSPQREAPSVCGFCGVGCSLIIGSADGRVVEVNPSHADDTVNRSTLCVRGHFAHDFLNAPERVTAPLLRKEAGLAKTTWEEALEFVAQELLSIRDRHGPQSIAFLGSSKCTIEENYLFQKIARLAIRTNNVDNGGGWSGRNVWNRLAQRLGGGGRVNPLSEVEEADVIVVWGADPARSAPVLGYHIRRASRLRGASVIVVDPIRTELVPYSSLWLAPAPDSDSELIHCIAALLVGKRSYDLDFIRHFTGGFEEYVKSLSPLGVERVFQATGVDVKAIEDAADLLAGKRIAFVVGDGIFLQRHGIQAIDGLVNLALLTGGSDRKIRIYGIPGENNEAGAWDMGTVPDVLPGRMGVSEDAARKYWERAWRAQLSPDPGLDMSRMIREAEKGNLKALYIMGENPVRGLPSSGRIQAAMKNLDLLVVQDILETETTRLAHVILPGAPFSEKGGAFTNMEGRIQVFEPAVPLPGEAKPDWEILDLLGGRLGLLETYRSVQQIRHEIACLVPGYAGLAGGRTTWVKENSRSSLFRSEGEGESASFSRYSSLPQEKPDREFPYKAIMGSSRFHLGSGTRTSHSSRIMDYAYEGGVEISPEDGRSLGLQFGEIVIVSSPYGSIRRKVILSEAVRPGHIYVPGAVHGHDAASLFPLDRSEGAEPPGMNVVSVKITGGGGPIHDL